MVSKQAIREYLRINPKLINAKVVCFAYTAGAVSLLAFLTIHMNWLGLSESQIGIIYGSIPAMNIFGPPIFGPLADKYQIHRQLLVALIVVTTVANNCLQLTPRYLTENVHLDLTVFFNENQIPMVNVDITEITSNSSLQDWDRYECSKLPTSMQFNFKNCKPKNSRINELFQSSRDDKLRLLASNNCSYSSKVANFDSIISSPQDVPNAYLQSTTINLFNFKLIKIEQIGDDPECQLPDDLSNTKCFIEIISDVSNSKMSLNKSDSPMTCNKVKGSSTKTFIIYFVIRAIAQVSINTCFVLLDAILLALIKEHKGDYGMQRLWQSIGIAIGVPLTGVACDQFSKHVGYNTYAPAFVIFAVTMAVAAVIIFCMRVPDEIKADAMCKNLGILARYPALWFFGLAILFLGCQWGNLEAFIFVFFKTLNATSTEMGLTITVGQLSGLPLIFLSKAIFQYTGEILIIIASFYIYVVRYFGYAHVMEMRWVYFFEVMEGFTNSLMWVAAVTYSARITPPGMYATVQTIIGALHFGFGKGLGSFIGGILWEHFGARTCYKILGIACLIGGLIYSALHICWLRKLEFKQIAVKFSTSSKLKKESDIDFNIDNNNDVGVRKMSVERNQIGKPFVAPNSSIPSNEQVQHLPLEEDTMQTPTYHGYFNTEFRNFRISNEAIQPKQSVTSVYFDANYDLAEVQDQARRRSMYLSLQDVA